MNDPRIRPADLMRIGRFFEVNGDDLNAIKAYRDVLLSDDGGMRYAASRHLNRLHRLQHAA